ncbi:MAG: type II toxin-antitoxin system VapC family toxin, partial [Polyangiales bacterium]
LLDTHALIWWANGDERLPARTRTLIADQKNEVLISVVSAWEMQIKVSLKKLKLRQMPSAIFRQLILEQNMRLLSIELEHFDALALLPSKHRDPFDRMLMAQAKSEKLKLVSKDPIFTEYGVGVQYD